MSAFSRFVLHNADHLRRAAVYSFKGLRAVARETAFQQECAVLLIVVPLAWWLGKSNLERAILIASWLLVMIVECLNCAIEALTDRVSTEHHVLSGQAKDAGSAAVFVAILTAIATWLIVLLT